MMFVQQQWTKGEELPLLELFSIYFHLCDSFKRQNHKPNEKSLTFIADQCS